MAAGESRMDKPHKLFISHSSKDVDYVEAFVGLLEILGLRDEEIICSSVGEMRKVLSSWE